MLLLFVVVIQYQVKYSGVSFLVLVEGVFLSRLEFTCVATYEPCVSPALRALLFLLSRSLVDNSLRIDGHHGDFIDVNWEVKYYHTDCSWGNSSPNTNPSISSSRCLTWRQNNSQVQLNNGMIKQ